MSGRVVLDLVSGCRSEWVVVLVTSAEVVKGSGRRLGDWDRAHASSGSPSALVSSGVGPYVVAGLSSPWRGGFGAAETSRRSEPHYGVRGGRTVVVRCGLSPWTCNVGSGELRSRDLFSFRTRRVACMGGGSRGGNRRGP
jgi:hypothetical protein